MVCTFLRCTVDQLKCVCPSALPSVKLLLEVWWGFKCIGTHMNLDVSSFRKGRVRNDEPILDDSENHLRTHGSTPSLQAALGIVSTREGDVLLFRGHTPKTRFIAG
jgi:hypothetical protein